MARLVKEDIGYAHGKTLQRVKDNLNAKGGKPTRLEPGRIILRPPTKKEIQAADTNPSDYQIAQLRILSKILYDFGLISQVYRAKKSTIARNNVKKIEKYKTIFHTFLQTFNSNEPIANVRRSFALTTDENFTTVDFLNVLASSKEWRMESQLLRNLSTVYRNIKNYGDDHEPTNADVVTVRDAYNHLSQYVNTELDAGHNEQEIKKSITYANIVNNLMAEPELENAYDLVYKDPNVNTVSDLEADINEYLTGQQSKGKYGHSNTLLHEEAVTSLRELSLKMKNDGFSGNLTTENIFEYLKANEPGIIENISTNYNISPDELSGSHFPTWESVAQYFYSPDMIRHIEFDLLKVDQRSRAVGENRKGALLAVDAKSVQNRKEALAKQIESREKGTTQGTTLQDKLDAKEKEYEEAKKIRDNFRADIVEAQNRGESKEVITQLEQKFEEAKTIAFKIGKTAASIRHALKLAIEAGTQNEVFKSDIEKLKELETQEKEIINKARTKLGDDDDLRAFDTAYRKEEEKVNNPWNFNPKAEIDYLTWSFVVNSTTDEVTDFIVNLLKTQLKQLSEYINVDKFEPEYDELDGTEIIVDYPAESKLAKILKKKPDFAYQMMDSIIFTIRKELKKKVRYYDNIDNYTDEEVDEIEGDPKAFVILVDEYKEKYVKINAPFIEDQEGEV